MYVTLLITPLPLACRRHAFFAAFRFSAFRYCLFAFALLRHAILLTLLFSFSLLFAYFSHFDIFMPPFRCRCCCYADAHTIHTLRCYHAAVCSLMLMFRFRYRVMLMPCYARCLRLFDTSPLSLCHAAFRFYLLRHAYMLFAASLQIFFDLFSRHAALLSFRHCRCLRFYAAVAIAARQPLYDMRRRFHFSSFSLMFRFSCRLLIF